MGWKSYGDPSYVDHVMRYLKGSNKDVKPVDGAIDGYENIMKEALKYEGQPYVWGGSNPKSGFDCSGLVQWSYAKAGITLPRTAQEQHGATKRSVKNRPCRVTSCSLAAHMKERQLLMSAFMLAKVECSIQMTAVFSILI